MKHLDLFSGIGGFALATEMVWDEVEHIFCDNEPYAQEILKKHWPTAKIYGDIRTLTYDSESERCGLRFAKNKGPTTAHEHTSCNPTFLLTGGFPCQPFSQAGRRKGTADDRFLWPEMLRVIREFRPRWVIGENVAGLLTIERGVVFEQVCADLEGEGYAVQAFVIPAVAVNAPHRRDRVWIVAHATSDGSERNTGEVREKNGGQNNERSIGAFNAGGNVTNTRRKYRKSRTSESPFGETTFWRTTAKETKRFNRDEWGKNWLEVATRLCRVDDGIPRRLDRTPRLKALGNAIVPQVAAEIMRAIKEVDV